MSSTETRTPAEIWQSHPRWKRVTVYVSLGLLAAMLLLIALAPEPEPTPEQRAQALQQAEATEAEKRERAALKQFSPFSGAHIATERAIKAALKDPDSYKHFETRYWLRPDGSLKVVTEVGARNGFGGMVRLVFEGIITPSGEVATLTQLN